MADARIAVVGEGMIELSPRAAGGWNLGHGGDALNTAIHLARLGGQVAFASAIGRDPFSQRLRESWAKEGLDCSVLLTDPDHEAGLYAIEVDEVGERSFTYWRSHSAARHMFDLPESDTLIERTSSCDLLYFSLITLAILPPESRDRLLAIARAVRANGGKVAFDGNYRPRLWASADDAIAARNAALATSDIGLPTFDDEAALCGAPSPAAVAAEWNDLGCGEVIMKQGAAGCLLPDGRISPPPAEVRPVDTSGAGDAFNAGYLHARLNGATPDEAATRGHSVAAWTIGRFGAIPPRDAQAPY